MGYTWAQFSAYLQLARKEAARRRLAHLVDSSNAFAGGDGARKHARDLADEANR